MEISKKLFINIYSLILSIVVFFNYIFGVQLPIIIISTFYLFVITKMLFKKINIYIYELIIILYPTVILLALINSSDIESSVKYFIGITCISISCILISKNIVIFNEILNLFMIFSSIHVMFTLIYAVFPKFVMSINKIILSSADYQKNYYEMTNNHINCGITPVQSLNAVYISIFIGLVLSKIFTNSNKKKEHYILLVLGIISLLLTTKRGVTLAVAIALIYTCYYYKYKINNKKFNLIRIIKNIFIIIFMILLIVILIDKYFPGALLIFKRFTQKDISTGRIENYKIIWSYFSDNPILGNGLYFSRIILDGNDAHNIYIQLLVETGLLGFLMFSVMIGYILCIMVSMKRKNIKEKEYIYIFAVYFFIVFLVYGLTGNPLFDYSILIPFYIAISIILNIFRRKDYNESRNINLS